VERAGASIRRRKADVRGSPLPREEIEEMIFRLINCKYIEKLLI
jgi:hypothetical protein